ncbi:MAG: hypothetical protein C4547_16255 [Phycisphaerales bacterium]|nr:MAG: hypothetical protein C4547_16255 [Phycisphaerales bacterium]
MADAAEFYVGYLRMPTRLAAFLRWVAAGLLLATAAIGWSLSRSQNDPGDGVWQDGLQTFVGRVAAAPYPLIRVPSDRPGKPIETILLVSQGKHGAAERIAGLDGRIARVRGTILERDGVRLLELTESGAAALDESLGPVEQARLATPSVAPLGTVTFYGEIIDPKCYSGAMKPGEGKTHKACATLCIAGGIPPMFVAFDAAGRRSVYLLTDPHGRALDDRILPYVADPVEIIAALERCDDLYVLRLDPECIRRR